MTETLAKFRGVELVCVSPRVKLELDCIDAQNRILGDVLEDALTIAARLGWRLVLTCVWRSKAEDRKLKGSGIHCAWRAVDWRTRDVPDGLVRDLRRGLDERWVYDPTRIDPETGQSTYPLCYIRPHGTGPHFHLQVHPETSRRHV